KEEKIRILKQRLVEWEATHKGGELNGANSTTNGISLAMATHQPLASVNSLPGGGMAAAGSGSGSTNNSLNLQATTSSSQHNTPAATLAITQDTHDHHT
ncbi:PREDICTED: uncharacterized protein LOC108376407, partial [Rhagoletis zephyria]|uniref:uncharacterized protein LOC108376407 n=1 Tax=Rhagoletis zephyria TaxID=28612 RepID=UPI000811893A